MVQPERGQLRSQPQISSTVASMIESRYNVPSVSVVENGVDVKELDSQQCGQIHLLGTPYIWQGMPYTYIIILKSS